MYESIRESGDQNQNRETGPDNRKVNVGIFVQHETSEACREKD